MSKIIMYVFIYILFSTEIFPQACCSAGTPLLGSLEISSGRENVLQFGLTYDYNSLQSVYEGSSKINDNTRERLTRSVLFEASYGISKSFVATALASFVNQNRTISSFNDESNTVTTNGIGDLVLLLKYNFITADIFNQTDLSFGAGVKLPTGKSDILNNGILLPADMQSGSGSVDYLLWGFYSKGFVPVIPLNIITNVSYKINTSHKRFSGSELGYKFGNEFIFSAGLGYRTDSVFDFSILFRLRDTVRDTFDGQKVPNTGGTWLYVIPVINFKLSDQMTSRLSSQLPVYRNLDGTQLTTSYTISLSLFYSHSFGNNF